MVHLSGVYGAMLAPICGTYSWAFWVYFQKETPNKKARKGTIAKPSQVYRCSGRRKIPAPWHQGLFLFDDQAAVDYLQLVLRRPGAAPRHQRADDLKKGREGPLGQDLAEADGGVDLVFGRFPVYPGQHLLGAEQFLRPERPRLPAQQHLGTFVGIDEPAPLVRGPRPAPPAAGLAEAEVWSLSPFLFLLPQLPG